jgi:hypothetical protein
MSASPWASGGTSPGLVYVPEWRPERPEEPFCAEPARSNGYGGVGRKP